VAVGQSVFLRAQPPQYPAEPAAAIEGEGMLVAA
jgi:hypothetical protein